MAKHLVSFNGSSATYQHDEQDGKVAFETVSDVTAILERAKALHNEGLTRTKGGQRHVASIPITVIDAWAKRLGKTYGDVMADQSLFTAFLKDPDHSYFILDKSAI